MAEPMDEQARFRAQIDQQAAVMRDAIPPLLRAYRAGLLEEPHPLSGALADLLVVQLQQQLFQISFRPPV